MRGPRDDDETIDVEVAKDEIRKASSSKRVDSVFDIEGLQALKPKPKSHSLT
jgi:hypothetical protein